MTRGFAGLVAALAVLASGAVTAASSPELSQASEALRLSIDEWKREDAAYRALRTANKIPRPEQESYAGYVAGLRLRVLEQCEVVRGLGGEAAVANFECVRTGPEEQRARATTAVVPPSAVLTDEEKKAATQARLDELEGEIDESLQKRQQEIRQTASAPRNARGGGAGGGGGQSGSAGSGQESGGATPKANTSTGTWSDPEARKRAGEGTTAGDKGGASSNEGTTTAGRESSQGARGPNDRQAATRQRPTDGGSDDDIVARQLREAAEKETDPVLKQKLWDEYRKYKEAKK